MSTGEEVFTDRYKITVLAASTRETTHHSYLVYKLVPLVGTPYVEDRFVALFAREEDAYDYVAYRTATDAGLDKERVKEDG